MKTNKLFIFCTVLAFILAFSCSVFTGSDFKGSESTKFEHELSAEEKAYNAKYRTIKKNGIVISTADQDYYGEYIINRASTASVITITVTGYTCADPATFEQAFKFYSLTDNTDSAVYYPKRGAEALGAQLKSSRTQKGVVTGVFFVDTSTVVTDYIAVLVDATVLKDTNGNLMLDNDGNKVAGQETDNCVFYLGVTHDVDGNTINDEILWDKTNANENFCPPLENNLLRLFNIANWSITTVEGAVVAESVVVSYEAKGSVPAGYYSNYKETLDKLAVLEYLAPGGDKWIKDSAFAFSYTDAYTYKATSTVFTAGTQWRLVFNPVEVVEETVAPVVYGHPVKKMLTTEVSYGTASDNTAGTINYYSESPAYIVNKKTTAFAAGNIAKSEIRDAQRDFFTVTSKGNGKFIVTLDSDYEFASWADFIVTDYSSSTYYGTKIPATVTQKADDKNQIVIQLKNKYFSNEKTVIWVGPGVTITENSVNTAQKQFGCYKWTDDKDASGYVNIWSNTSF